VSSSKIRIVINPEKTIQENFAKCSLKWSLGAPVFAFVELATRSTQVVQPWVTSVERQKSGAGDWYHNSAQAICCGPDLEEPFQGSQNAISSAMTKARSTAV
jgi:hypothetical protein